MENDAVPSIFLRFDLSISRLSFLFCSVLMTIRMFLLIQQHWLLYEV